MSTTWPDIGKPAVYSVKQFCHDHDISYGKYYDLVRKGLGPKTMKYGTRRVISQEAAARWRAEREEA